MSVAFDDNPDTPKALNRLAREQAKEKILKDIRFDLEVCDLEGWDKTEYINELREFLDSFGGGTSGTQC